MKTAMLAALSVLALPLCAGVAQDAKQEGKPEAKKDVVVPPAEILTVERDTGFTNLKAVKTPRGDRLQFEWKGKTYRVLELRFKPKPSGENAIYQIFRPEHPSIPVQIPLSAYPMKNRPAP